MNSTPSLVLYAEDDEDDALFMRRAFQRACVPAQLEIVDDGAKAIAFLSRRLSDRQASSVPSLVLLDLKMPRASGLEVLRWIRDNPTLCHIAVLLVTSSSHDRDVRQAFELGANGFLVKPSDANLLIERIRAIWRSWSEAGFPTPSWWNLEGFESPPCANGDTANHPSRLLPSHH